MVVAVAIGGAVAPGVGPAGLVANVVPLGSGTTPAHTPLAVSLLAHVQVKGPAPWRGARLAMVAGARVGCANLQPLVLLEHCLLFHTWLHALGCHTEVEVKVKLLFALDVAFLFPTAV